MSLILSGTDGLSDIDGSAATPAIRGTDANTGIFFPAADTIAFAEGGAEVARFDSSGNLGIGTTSPVAKLDVRGILAIANSAASYWALDRNDADGALTFSDGATERARIDSSGRLLVGASIFGNGCTTATANLPSFAGINSINNGSTVAFNFGVPTTTSNTNLGNFFNGNGQVGSITVNASATSYNTSSDYRLKNITGPITGAKDFILALKPKQGTWKVDGSAFVGFLAHEFQEVSPLSVSGEKDAVDADGKPIMQTMQASSSEVIANIVSLLQEQQAIITQLQADVAALKA